MSSEYDPRQAASSGQATASGGSQASGATSAGYPRTAPTSGYQRSGGAALGFTVLAGALLILGGLWQFFEGLAAVIKGSFFVVTPNYAYNIDIRSWGWIHIGIGAALFLVGCCVLARQTWARIVAIFIAVISAVMNLMFIPRYPLWSIAIVVLDVFIVWALVTVQRREAY